MAGTANSVLMAKTLAKEKKKKAAHSAGKAHGIQYSSGPETADFGAQQYNNKMMNSIWGMYNQYSVHNLKALKDDHPAEKAAAARSSSPGPAKDLNRFFNQYNFSDNPQVGANPQGSYAAMTLDQLKNAIASNWTGSNTKAF